MLIVKRLTMHLLPGVLYTAALCTCGHLENRLRWFQGERFIARCYYRWCELRAGLFDLVSIIEESSHWK